MHRIKLVKNFWAVLKLPVPYLLLFVSLTMLACSHIKPGWKTIELGGYLLDVPNGFNYKFQQGIDSQGGTITDGKMKLYTNFGYYTDTLFQTPQEYLNKKYYTDDAMGQFMKSGVTYDSRTYPKIEVLSVRPATARDSDRIGFFSGCDYIATCRHEKEVFTWAVRLPADVKQHTVKIDTFNHMYRRIATPKLGYQGETAVYMRDKRSFNKSINNYYGIVIGKDSLTAKQQALALEMFKTLRLKK